MKGVIGSSVVPIQRTTAWVSHLLCFLVCRNKGFGRFPDDILINILSRLPADAVLQCRKVCRHWRSLTSSTHFIALQDQRAPSVILLLRPGPFYSFKKRGGDFYVYDALAKKLRKIPFKSKFGFEGRDDDFFPIHLYAACGPLLHYKASGYYHCSWGRHSFAFNLFTRQLGALKVRTKHSVCGMFFNESRNEYNYVCALWRPDEGCRFCVYSLDSRTDVEIACSPFSCRTYANRSPIVVNGALYMMVYPVEKDINECMHAILAFEMGSGKFYTLPHPEFGCPRTKHHHLGMYLFVHDGHLCISHNGIVLGGRLDIWILKDYANWYWVPLSSTISLPIPKGSMTNAADFVIQSVGRDELLVNWDPYLFLVNLKEHRVEKIKTPHKGYLDPSFRLVAYKSTLAAPPLVWDESIPPRFSL